MPTDPPPDPFAALLGRLVAAVEQDGELRVSLSALARAAAGWLDRLGPHPTPPRMPVEAIESPPSSPAPPPEPLAPPPVRSSLTLKDLNVPFLLPPDLLPPSPVPTPERSDRAPMPTLAARSRVKAEAARLLAGEGGDAVAIERRASALPDCRLWMLFDPPTTPPAVWRDLAGAYEAAAAAADLIVTWDGLPETQADATAAEVLLLAAEAQSTLMAAVSDTRMISGYDEEQLQIFLRLRDETSWRRIKVDRFMKRTDRADPARAADVRRRVLDVADRLKRSGGQDRQRQKHLKNAFRKLDLIRADPAGNAGEWPRVLEIIDVLVADGLPPSHAELRDHLLAVWDHLPPELAVPAGAGRVLTACERFLEDRPVPATPAIPEPPSAEVAAVAGTLRGRELVLIGGQSRPQHKKALCDAFGLADVRWLSTPEHTSYTVFEPDIARPEVAVVVLAVRWMSHDYDRVSGYCERYGKPLVRLTAGYNPNQLAHQIVAQVGRKLGLPGD